ncbi:MAG: substrate-binding domain-containing protein [Nitrospirae bacterium]|nr:substrate-binding domain-containing protein [Nitrospirota bacterium]
MNKRDKYAAAVILLVALIAAFIFLPPKKDKRVVVFFSGSGMKIPVAEIARDFTASTGIAVDVHLEGSSILRQYIETYGEAELFLSGDKENIDILDKKGLVKKSAFIAWHIPSILVPEGNRKNITGLDDLAEKGMRIVIANPKQAASGKLISEMLRRHPKGKEILSNVVVYGSSTNDTLRVFKELYKKGAADAVLEWDIMVHVPEGRGLTVIPFDKKYEIKDPLMQAMLKNSHVTEDAQRFYDYFRTEGVKAFEKHGYNTKAKQ